jgi:hypothetical protein
MITTSEFQHRSIMDATTFRATMEHGLSSLNTDLCDNLVDQLKQAAIQEDSTLHPSSSAGAHIQRPPTRQRPGQYYVVPDSDDSDGTDEVHSVHGNVFMITHLISSANIFSYKWIVGTITAPNSSLILLVALSSRMTLSLLLNDFLIASKELFRPLYPPTSL